jgi:bacterioferritin (cytochrome b1)
MQLVSRSHAIGALAAAGVTLALAPAVALAAGRADSGDLTLLQSAISYELAAIKMYADAVSANLLTPVVANVTNQFSADHAAHRDALIAQVQQGGGTPSTTPAPLQAPDMKTEADFLGFALAGERQIATVYLAAIPQFKNRDLAKLTASILGVDATHIALLTEALKQSPPYPGGFLA